MDILSMINLEDIQAAYVEVRKAVHHTPVSTCRSLEERIGMAPEQLLLKMENMQRTGRLQNSGRVSSPIQFVCGRQGGGSSGGERGQPCAGSSACREADRH